MENKDKNENRDNNSTNITLPPNQQEPVLENVGYNCSECSSLIEIILINDDKLSFKCENNHNINDITIKDYLERMKKHIGSTLQKPMMMLVKKKLRKTS